MRSPTPTARRRRRPAPPSSATTFLYAFFGLLAFFFLAYLFFASPLGLILVLGPLWCLRTLYLHRQRLWSGALRKQRSRSDTLRPDDMAEQDPLISRTDDSTSDTSSLFDSRASTPALFPVSRGASPALPRAGMAATIPPVMSQPMGETEGATWPPPAGIASFLDPTLKQATEAYMTARQTLVSFLYTKKRKSLMLPASDRETRELTASFPDLLPHAQDDLASDLGVGGLFAAHELPGEDGHLHGRRQHPRPRRAEELEYEIEMGVDEVSPPRQATLRRSRSEGGGLSQYARYGYNRGARRAAERPTGDADDDFEDDWVGDSPRVVAPAPRRPVNLARIDVAKLAAKTDDQGATGGGGSPRGTPLHRRAASGNQKLPTKVSPVSTPVGVEDAAPLSLDPSVGSADHRFSSVLGFGAGRRKDAKQQ